jgi:inorganic pyrophosphatase
MTDYTKLPTWADKQYIYVVVETPRGSRCKLEFDTKLQVFNAGQAPVCGADVSLRLGIHSVNSSRRGHPLDVLMIHDAATYPGLVLRCKPIFLPERSPFDSYGCKRPSYMRAR